MKKTLLLAVCAAFALNLNAVDLAKYNGKVITEKDIDPIVLPSGQAVSILQFDAEKRKEIIYDYVTFGELLKEAKSKKYDNDKEFKEALKKESDKLLVEYYHQKTILSQAVSDKEINDYYNQHKDAFFVKGQNQVAHILVQSEKEAKAIVNDLKNLTDEALAKKFIELAKTKSIEPGAKETSGVLPVFDKDGKTPNGSVFLPEFVATSLKLKVGEVSAPVKTKYGYHVILKLNESKDQVVALEQVKNNIKSSIQLEKYKKFLQDKKDSLIKKIKVEFE